MPGRNAGDKYFDAAPEIGVNDAGRIAVGESMQLAIAHGGSFAREIEKFLAAGTAKLADGQRRRCELTG